MRHAALAVGLRWRLFSALHVREEVSASQRIHGCDVVRKLCLAAAHCCEDGGIFRDVFFQKSPVGGRAQDILDLLSVCQETTGVQYTSRSFAFFVPCTAHSTEDNNDISHEDFLQQQRRDIEIKITKEEQF